MHRDKPASGDDTRPEYDFSGGVRGSHHLQYQAGTNVVFLDPDMARVFRDSASVNRALRLLLDLAKTNCRQIEWPDSAPANSPGN